MGSKARSYLLKPELLRQGFYVGKRTSGEMHRPFAYSFSYATSPVWFSKCRLWQDKPDAYGSTPWDYTGMAKEPSLNAQLYRCKREYFSLRRTCATQCVLFSIFKGTVAGQMEAEQNKLSSSHNHCSKISIILTNNRDVTRFLQCIIYLVPVPPIDFYESSVKRWRVNCNHRMGFSAAFGFLGNSK